MQVTPRSLLGRLTATFAAIAILVTALAAWVLVRQVRRAVDTVHALSLEAVLNPLSDRLHLAGIDSLAEPLPEPLVARFDTAGGTVSFVVLDAADRVVASSARAGRWLPRLGLNAEEPEVAFRIEDADRRFWGLSRVVDTPQGPMTVQVGQDMTSPFVVIDDVPGVTFVPIIVLLAGGGMLMLSTNLGLTRLLLRPLNSAAAEAAAIVPGAQRRIGARGMPAEVLPLIQAVNAALDRLDEALERQRRFSHDVAHEIRTPLAILTTELDLLADSKVSARLRGDVEHLAQIVDQLLESAESAPPSPDDETDLAQLCREVAERLSATAQREGRSIEVQGADVPIWVRGDPVELRRAVVNLVDNALRHTARGTTVQVRLAPPATVEVADRGPGVPGAHQALVFERFWRADRTARRGSGIGLALVSEIASRHGGTVTVRDNPGGGAVFALSLLGSRAA
ncbi:sensor histidine kinase [Roseomonas rosulenta]|uniref:sensor histidine kinase n=1 Tax=Roseomonas rosulenta TaxID=2748667 RepID=UPI0018DF7A96|nr:HAMP domain-containing sensor histidine kinase [Roseomonas rosulenta]